MGTKWSNDKGRPVQQPQLRMTENHQMVQREGSASPAPAKKRNRGGRNKKKAAPKAGDAAKATQEGATESAEGSGANVEDAPKALAAGPANPEAPSSSA